jgi:hypothetical protein
MENVQHLDGICKKLDFKSLKSKLVSHHKYMDGPKRHYPSFLGWKRLQCKKNTLLYRL